MTEAEIRAAINKWGSEKVSRQKGLGDQLAISSVTPASAFVVRVQTQCEERSVAASPYAAPKGAYDLEIDGDPQTFPVHPPDEFKDSSMSFRVSGTRRSSLCLHCRGQKTTSCTACGGSGRTRCTRCGGMGFISTNQTRSVFRGGKTVFETQRVNTPCSCGGGRVACASCGSTGSKPCPHCGATGNVVTIDVLSVRFSNARATQVVNATGVPDDVLMNTAGELLVEANALDGTVPAHVSPDLKAIVGGVLRECGCRAGTVVRRRLTIEKVPVWCVHYSTKGHAQNLWVYGSAAAVHAPDVPSRWLSWLSR